MFTRFLLVLSLLPFAMKAQAADTAVFDQMLREIRELRSDLQGLTVVSQRVQILLYRVQLQDNVVRRCLSRHDEFKSKVAEIERKRSSADSEIRTWTAKMATPENPGDREAAEGMVRELKPQFELWAREESQARSAEAESANELRKEEAKLNEFQTRLELMERQLEVFQGARPSK